MLDGLSPSPPNVPVRTLGAGLDGAFRARPPIFSYGEKLGFYFSTFCAVPINIIVPNNNSAASDYYAPKVITIYPLPLDKIYS